MNSSPDKTYRRFLLGIASEEEECRVEEAVLTGELDDSSLENAEDELIDDYLLGHVTQEEKRGFEQQFLVTEERKQKLKFASTLVEYSCRELAVENPVMRTVAPPSTSRAVFPWKSAAFLAAAASVLLATWAGVEEIQLGKQEQIARDTRDELRELRAASAPDNRAANEMAAGSSGALKGTNDAMDRLPLIEFASATRTVYPAVFRVPTDARFARIDWKLSSPFANKYREVLLSGSGLQLWAQEFTPAGLSPSGRSTIVIPTSILVPGIYHLRLEGDSGKGQFEELGDSVFRVIKE